MPVRDTSQVEKLALKVSQYIELRYRGSEMNSEGQKHVKPFLLDILRYNIPTELPTELFSNQYVLRLQARYISDITTESLKDAACMYRAI